MAIENIDGFRVSDGNTLIIDQEKISECMEFFKKNHLKRIWISRFHGYTDNIDFLKEYDFLKEVILKGPFDISGLYALNDLEFLSYENLNPNQVLDLGCFKKITTCGLDLKSKVRNLNSLTKVKDIRLFHYTVKEKDLTGLDNLKQLESLFISMSNVESLKGIEAFEKLKYIEFHYLRNLTQIQAVASLSDTLEFLTFGNAKKITDFESVTALKKLKTLGFNSCGSIPSIKFINDMPNLEDFRFMSTVIADGDMTPTIRLKYAAFSNKKHFSHTLEQIRKYHPQ
jgi:protein phosphatase 1 regulatory subunit 7